MIPFEEIDSRLSKLDKDRAWLANNTPYSADYIRTVLAPKSTRRTKRVQEVLSAAIEREESARLASPPSNLPPDVLVIELDRERYQHYSTAAKEQRLDLKQWTIAELDRAAKEWQAEQARANFNMVGEEPPELPARKPSSEATDTPEEA